MYTCVYVFICTCAQQGTYYSSSLEISFDVDISVYSRRWLMNGILFCLPVCVVSVLVSDTYFLLMSTFSSLHQTSSVFSHNFFSPWLNSVTVWCLVYWMWVWVQHLWASDALSRGKEFPWQAWGSGSIVSETSQGTSVSPWAVWEQKWFPLKLKWALFRVRNLRY